ncbi:expressed protein [Echinococcus multilocularis]|uniref:Expressed protein n=1 Tax=Echinococcus multilocularis TaxID=6211 RepID=A0A077RCV3_ECHMU|nr:expressed protein [Echinococcus multilocularis]CDI97569.1 expressed protein [Echinococcus multilocularis]
MEDVQTAVCVKGVVSMMIERTSPHRCEHDKRRFASSGRGTDRGASRGSSGDDGGGGGDGDGDHDGGGSCDCGCGRCSAYGIGNGIDSQLYPRRQ